MAPRPPTWHVLTGEYPPDLGGVSDHSAQVARALAAAGERVHVWAPAAPGAPAQEADGPVRVHRLPAGFTPRGLPALSAALASEGGPRRLLVQYVPHAFGLRGANLPFAAWLARRPREEQVWLYAHEVVFPFGLRWPVAGNALAVATRLMAALVAARADRLLVTTPRWVRHLPAAVRRAAPEWLPVPSNVDTAVSEEAVRAERAASGVGARRGEGLLAGHFGTCGAEQAALLEPALARLLAAPGRRGVLVGRGSAAYLRALSTRAPGLAARLQARDGPDAAGAAAALGACDVLVQPYPDGVSTRRTTAMAALALGVPLVTHAGPSTEAPWHTPGALVLAPSARALGAAAEALLAEPARAAAVGAAGRTLYAGHFALERTVAVLLGRAPAEAA